MTKAEIIKALEALKELTNEGGKNAIEGIKAAVAELQEAAPVPIEVPQADEPDVEPEELAPEKKVHPKAVVKAKKHPNVKHSR